MAFTLGNSSKDSKYLKRIKDAIEGDKEHPRHHGVKMQAHHLISGEGMKRSGMGKEIEKFGYDINLLPNLVFIPCTLQGACHLGVQPHRGNHSALIDQDNYDDDKEPDTYHELIGRRVRELELPLDKECPGDKKTKSEVVKRELDLLSKKIADFIQKNPNEAPLTAIAKQFSIKSQVGCGGVDSVTVHKMGAMLRCPVERNHCLKQGPGQKNEDIAYSSNGKYKLTPGR